MRPRLNRTPKVIRYIISRDRAGAYAEGARQSAPQARQVADRFHLVKNLGDTLERVLTRHHASLRAAASPAPTDPPPIDAPTQDADPRRERHAAARQRRWHQRYDTIQAVHRQGHSIHGIARTFGLARTTVRSYLRAPTVPVAGLRPARPSLLDPSTTYLAARWTEGCHNATQLWREIRQRGFTGGRSIVRAYVAAWREGTPPARQRRWSARQTMWLLRQPPEILDDAERTYVERLTALVPEIAQAHTLTTAFLDLIRTRDRAAPEPWLTSASAADIPEFHAVAAGIRRDQAAVEAALELDWNTAMVEGQITRLKLIKRQGYGRSGFDLLRQRVLANS